MHRHPVEAEEMYFASAVPTVREFIRLILTAATQKKLIKLNKKVVSGPHCECEMKWMNCGG